MSLQNKFPPIHKLINLKGKRALVTGGATGIGFAIAYRLAEAGATVMVADINSPRGESAVQSLIDTGFQAYFAPCDVSKDEDISRTVSLAVSKMDGIDILVNNAGIFPFTPLLELKSDDIKKILDVNLKGALIFSREVSRWMIEHRVSGNIINIASIDALHPSHSGMSVYDASKGAIVSLTRSLARELGPNGIRVNAIAPGGILTEGALSQRGQTGANRSALKEFLSRIVMGRMGVADDIGRAALFLASDLSSYITGSLLVVDGGYLLS